MAPTIITLLYPVTTTPFDFSYYTSKHMTLVQKKWGDKGLISWFVAKLDEASGSVVNCTMYWESAQAFQKAVTTDGTEIMKDVENYTDGKPVTYVGSEIAKS